MELIWNRTYFKRFWPACQAGLHNGRIYPEVDLKSLSRLCLVFYLRHANVCSRKRNLEKTNCQKDKTQVWLAKQTASGTTLRPASLLREGRTQYRPGREQTRSLGLADASGYHFRASLTRHRTVG